MNRDEYPLAGKHHVSISDGIVILFVGFAIGFITCHKLYTGFENNIEQSMEIQP